MLQNTQRTRHRPGENPKDTRGEQVMNLRATHMPLQKPWHTMRHLHIRRLLTIPLPMPYLGGTTLQVPPIECEPKLAAAPNHETAQSSNAPRDRNTSITVLTTKVTTRPPKPPLRHLTTSRTDTGVLIAMGTMRATAISSRSRQNTTKYEFAPTRTLKRHHH